MQQLFTGALYNKWKCKKHNVPLKKGFYKKFFSYYGWCVFLENSATNHHHRLSFHWCQYYKTFFLCYSCKGEPGTYSHHFIFFVAYQWAQKARVLDYTSLESIVKEKHSSFLGPFTSYEENTVLWIKLRAIKLFMVVINSVQ